MKVAAMHGSSIEGQSSRLFELETAFERSRAAEVPTYAPESFAQAQRLLDGIRNNWPEYRSNGTLDQQIALASEALEEARGKARASGPHLSNLVRVRAQAIRSSTVAYYCPQELGEAERLFQDAVRSAEEQDLSTASERVAAGEASYFEATLKSLEKGALQRLEHDIEYARNLVSSDLHAQAQAEFQELTDASRSARSGEISLSALRGRIATGTIRIRRLIDIHGGGPLDAGRPDPPMAPGGGGWAPGTYGPPPAPVTMRIKKRKADALTVVWRNLGGVVDATLLERSTVDGPWQVVADFGPLDEWTTFEDTGLSPDTVYSYRVRAQNEFGSNVTVHDNMAVGCTRTTEDLPVWRVQLYIRVADVPNAGTEDSVRVRLNSPLLNYSPNSNDTWLDHAPRPVGTTVFWRDDFLRGSEFLYDVKSEYVRQLSDITMISLRKEGTDALGIAELALVVNGREVFRKFYGDTASTCLWFDEEDGFAPTFVYHPELRASRNWQRYVESPPDFPLTIPNEEIVSRFEAIVGDSLHGTPGRWRTALRPVRVTRATVEGEMYEKVHVSLLLSADAGSLLPDPDINIGFDLQVFITCNLANTEATLNLISSDVHSNVDFDLLVDLLLLGLAPAGEALLVYATHLASEAVNAAWEPIVEHLVIVTLLPGACPKVQIDQDPDGDAIVVFRPF